MLSRLYDDPAHMDHVVDHLVAHVETLRVRHRRRRNDRIDAPRTAPARRTITWTDPARVALPAAQPRRLRALARDQARRGRRRRPRSRCSACSSTSSSAAAPCSRSSPTSCTRTRWARCTAASSRRSSTPRWAARSSSTLPADAGFTTLELEHQLRARDHAGDRTRLRRRHASCTAAAASRRPKRASTTTRHAVRARDVDVPDHCGGTR